MGFLNKAKLVFSKIYDCFNPRYSLILEEKNFDQKTKQILYRFKAYGDHTFPKFTAQEILSNENLKKNIHPDTLIDIVREHDRIECVARYYKIKEIYPHENSYKIGNSESEEILSGEEICGIPLILEQLENGSLYKIAYTTGFNQGRKLEKELYLQSKAAKNKNNIIELKVCK